MTHATATRGSPAFAYGGLAACRRHVGVPQREVCGATAFATYGSFSIGLGLSRLSSCVRPASHGDQARHTQQAAGGSGSRPTRPAAGLPAHGHHLQDLYMSSLGSQVGLAADASCPHAGARSDRPVRGSSFNAGAHLLPATTVPLSGYVCLSAPRSSPGWPQRPASRTAVAAPASWGGGGAGNVLQQARAAKPARPPDLALALESASLPSALRWQGSSASVARQTGSRLGGRPAARRAVARAGAGRTVDPVGGAGRARSSARRQGRGSRSSPLLLAIRRRGSSRSRLGRGRLQPRRTRISPDPAHRSRRMLFLVFASSASLRPQPEVARASLQPNGQSRRIPGLGVSSSTPILIVSTLVALVVTLRAPSGVDVGRSVAGGADRRRSSSASRRDRRSAACSARLVLVFAKPFQWSRGTAPGRRARRRLDGIVTDIGVQAYVDSTPTSRRGCSSANSAFAQRPVVGTPQSPAPRPEGESASRHRRRAGAARGRGAGPAAAARRGPHRSGTLDRRGAKGRLVGQRRPLVADAGAKVALGRGATRPSRTDPAKAIGAARDTAAPAVTR